MNAAKPSEFKHTTLAIAPESIVEKDGQRTWTPKQAGITLLDEEPGFTGIYVRDINGGLWPARTVWRGGDNYKSICDSWMTREGAVDQRKFKEPTKLDQLAGGLVKNGINIIMESDQKLSEDSDGFYERFGSDAAPHVGFEVEDFGDDYFLVTVKCPVEFGGKTEKYTGDEIVAGVARIVKIFGPKRRRKN